MRLVEYFEQGLLGRLEAKLLHECGVDLLEPTSHVLGGKAVFGRIELDAEMLGLEGLVAVEHFEHLERVIDANVERVGLERSIEHLFGLNFLAQPHQHHAQATGGLDQPRHAGVRLAVILRRGRPAPQTIEGISQRKVEVARVRIAGIDFGYDFSETRLGPAVGHAVGR